MTTAAVSKRPLAYTSVVQFEGDAKTPRGSVLTDPDRRDGAVYLLDPELKLAVEVALVTGRPLLLRGKPGTGKSSLAAWVARNLNWRYYEHVVTARTRAQDLMYTFDNLRRLAAAQARTKGDPDLNDFDYVQPGVLWWLLDPVGASRRGAADGMTVMKLADEPNAEINTNRDPKRAVLLIDEIDKADPDVPNNLLVALGSFVFQVEETGVVVRRAQVPAEENVSRLLVILTTNEERDLPDAFLRRCVVYLLEPPDSKRLLQIAKRHFGTDLTGARLKLAEDLATKMDEITAEAEGLGIRGPSTAEYLDAVRACISLETDPTSTAWEHIKGAVLLKPRTLPEGSKSQPGSA